MRFSPFALMTFKDIHLALRNEENGVQFNKTYCSFITIDFFHRKVKNRVALPEQQNLFEVLLEE